MKFQKTNFEYPTKEKAKDNKKRIKKRKVKRKIRTFTFEFQSMETEASA